MGISNFFSTFKISSAALSAEKKQLNLTAENIANATTTRTADGTPYKRKILVKEMNDRGNHFSNVLRNARLQLRTSSGHHFSKANFHARGAAAGEYVNIKTTVEEIDNFKQIYDPDHPDANEEGIVLFPEINVIKEMLELISASHSYEANITIMNATKSIARRSLEI